MALIFVGKPDVHPDYFFAENHSDAAVSGDEMNLYDGYGPYDHFRVSKRRRRLTPEEIEAKQQKRKDFWSNLGKNVQQGGGAEGLGKTVDNILKLFRKNEGEAEDYSVDLPTGPPENDPKGIPNSVLIIGGVVLLSMAGLGYVIYKNRKTV